MGGARGSYIDCFVSSCDDGYMFVFSMECSLNNKIATTNILLLQYYRSLAVSSVQLACQFVTKKIKNKKIRPYKLLDSVT
jgi:hypothetical protein